MKRLFITAVLSGLGLITFAQGEYDVFRYSQGDLLGTSRYMAMAGAFGALGGDMSAVSQNPGGIGVYRSSELSITPVLGYSTVSSDFNSTDRSDGKLVPGLNNIGYICSFRPTNSETINNINFGISYTRTKDFGRNTLVSDKDKTYSLLHKISSDFSHKIPGQLCDLGKLAYDAYVLKDYNYTTGEYVPELDGEKFDKSFFLNESGYSGVIDFLLGANWGHFMYMGASVGLNVIDYDMMSSYSERSHGILGNDVDITEFELRNAVKTTGTGVNFKIGAILRPFPFLRFGFALHSPTYYTMTDAFGSSMLSNRLDVDERVMIPENKMDYQVQTPGKIMYSAAYLFGQRAIISFDCDVVDYRDMSAKFESGMPHETTNEAIDNHFKSAYNVRIGGEYRIGDNFSVRAGFARYDEANLNNLSSTNTFVRTVGTTPHYSFDKGTVFITGGVGYRSGAFSLDAAVTDRRSGEYFYPYYDAGSDVAGVNKYADVKLSRLNLAVTAGIRF